MFIKLNERLRTVRRVHAINFREEMKLAFTILKHRFDKRNVKLDITVQVDDIKYRLVDLESLFIASPRYEKFVWKHIAPTKNDVFIDIGAHIGKYTLRIARIVGAQGKVLAIEPDPDNFRALLEAIKMNKFGNIVALNVAAYDIECTLPLYISPAQGKTPEGWLIGKGWSSLKHRKVGSVHEVLAKPLDKIVEDLRIHYVNYVKIDAEGAEYEVLKGSRKVIEKYRPKIIAECTLNQIAVLRFMKELKYSSKLIAPNYYFFKPLPEVHKPKETGANKHSRKLDALRTSKHS
jgi:FkbM family methyltransferase